MKFLSNRTNWGLLLIVGGALLLLQNLAVIPDSASLWAIIFGALGLYFLLTFLRNSDQWWAVFPALGFLGIAGSIVAVEMSNLEDEWAGVVFLGATSLAFFAIYLRRRQHWWPLIPAGVIASVAVIVATTAFDPNPPASLITSIVFGGLTLTCLTLFISPSEAGRARWAIWPAGVFLFFALSTGILAFDLANFILPVVMIVLGGSVLLRNMRKN